MTSETDPKPGQVRIRPDGVRVKLIAVGVRDIGWVGGPTGPTNSCLVQRLDSGRRSRVRIERVRRWVLAGVADPLGRL